MVGPAPGIPEQSPCHIINLYFSDACGYGPVLRGYGYADPQADIAEQYLASRRVMSILLKSSRGVTSRCCNNAMKLRAESIDDRGVMALTNT
jgi:hypothetical protein